MLREAGAAPCSAVRSSDGSKARNALAQPKPGGSLEVRTHLVAVRILLYFLLPCPKNGGASATDTGLRREKERAVVNEGRSDA